MKILFNFQFNNCNKNNEAKMTKNAPSFFNAKFPNFKGTLDKDTFVHSKSPVSKSRYIDDVLLGDIPNTEEIEPEIITLAKISYIASDLLYESSQNLKRLEKGETSFENILNTVCRLYSPQAKKGFENFRQKIGFTADEQLIEVTKIYNALIKKKNNFQANSIEIIELYCKLNNPQDILSFPETLLEASFDNSLREHFDYNEILDFIKMLGAKNEDALYGKTLAHLAKDFNDFRTPDDKLQAIEYERNIYKIKKHILELAKASNPEAFCDIDIDEFYAKNISVIDYIFQSQSTDADIFAKTVLTMIFSKFYEPIEPYTINALKNIIDAKTPQGRLDLYDFLATENIPPDELQELTKQNYYDGISCSDVIINRADTIKEMAQYYNIPTNLAEACYGELGHTINAVSNSEMKFFDDPLYILISALNSLELTTDSDFCNFYLELTKNSAKAQKNKKSTQKISQKDIANFINLLGFLDDDIAQKYKQNKKYPLYLELKKRKTEFEKAQDEIERLIAKHNARRYSNSAYYIFKKYHEIYKSSKNIDSFVLQAVEKEKEEARTSNDLEEKFLFYFDDEETLGKFLSKNHVNLNEETSHTKLCNKILDCLVANKEEQVAKELCKKLANSDFIANSQSTLGKFISSRSDEELQTLLEIILNENIASAQEIMTMLKPYLNKQKKINGLLAHFKAQNIDFRSYLVKLAQIQKDLDNYGFSIKLNNDNVGVLDFNNLKGNKTSLNQACEIARKILNPQGDSFMLGLGNATVQGHPPYTIGQIAKEIILSQTGKYSECYYGFLDSFRLNCEDLGFNKPDSEYEKALQEILKNELSALTSLINSDVFLLKFQDNQIPNLTLHAKMRLIDRFILQENKNIFSQESLQELKDIINTIYTKKPHKMKEANGNFAAYFLHDDYEIKTVFTKDGQLITIAKNKL